MASRSLEELENQIKALQAEAEELRLAEGIEQLRVVIRKYGVGLPHFKIALDTDKKRKQKRLLPTHRNPNNPAETWTGRGRKPRWLVAALDAGKPWSSAGSAVRHRRMPRRPTPRPWPEIAAKGRAEHNHAARRGQQRHTLTRPRRGIVHRRPVSPRVGSFVELPDDRPRRVAGRAGP